MACGTAYATAYAIPHSPAAAVHAKFNTTQAQSSAAMAPEQSRAEQLPRQGAQPATPEPKWAVAIANKQPHSVIVDTQAASATDLKPQCRSSTPRTSLTVSETNPPGHGRGRRQRARVPSRATSCTRRSRDRPGYRPARAWPGMSGGVWGHSVPWRGSGGAGSRGVLRLCIRTQFPSVSASKSTLQ